MPFKAKNFVRTSLTTTNATLYTHSSTNGKGSVRTITLNNNTSIPVQVYLNIVAAAGTASASNAVIPGWKIQPLSTVEFSTWKPLEATGDTIQGYASIGSVISISVDGAFTS